MRNLRLLLILLSSLIGGITYAQSVGINADGSIPAASAMLDIKSNNKGLLLPRVALTGTTDNTTVASPVISLLVYNTATAGNGATAVTPGFYYWDGTGWLQIGTGNSGWGLTGNAGTVSGTNFLGTTDNQPLQFRVNNQRAGYIGGYDAFFGYQAGNGITTGYSNIAIGYKALLTTEGGSENIAIGEEALGANINGSGNVAIGKFSLAHNTNSSNTALGRTAMNANVDGYENTAVGRSSLFNNTSGFQNTTIGRNALFNNTTGSLNTALGFKTDVAANNLVNATVIGANAYASCSNCMILGSVNGVNGATSDVNVGIGTTTPRGAFDVKKDGDIYLSTTPNGGSAQSTYLSGHIYLAPYGTNDISYIQARRANDQGPMSLELRTTNAGTILSTLHLHSDGNVGIGTTNPSQPLSFKNVAGGKVSFYQNGVNHYGIGIQGGLLQLYTDAPTADIAFGYGNSNAFTETMRIKGNADVGIGTTTPRGVLDVAKDGAIYLSSAPNGGSGQTAYLPGHIFLAPYSNTNISYIQARRANDQGPMSLSLRTTNAANSVLETLFLRDNGNVGIGTTAPAQPLSFSNIEGGKISFFDDGVSGDHYGIGIQPHRLQFYIPATDNRNAMEFGRGHSEAFTPLMTLGFGGSLWIAGTLTQNSDIRLKQNIKALQGSLTAIEQLNGYTYYWKDKTKDSSLQVGVIAQEVQKVLPELVKADDKGTLSVNYSGLIPVLIEALKEQQEQIATLQKENKELQQVKNELAELKKQVQALTNK